MLSTNKLLLLQYHDSSASDNNYVSITIKNLSFELITFLQILFSLLLTLLACVFYDCNVDLLVPVSFDSSVTDILSDDPYPL